MDGDIGAMLQSVLSDPEQMAKLTQMAQGLMGAQQEQQTQAEPTAVPPAVSGGGMPFSIGETQLLSALGRAFASGGGKSRSTALLTAMRPYMKPEKQEKLDRAMRLARLLTIASAVMKEYGGGDYGL